MHCLLSLQTSQKYNLSVNLTEVTNIVANLPLYSFVLLTTAVRMERLCSKPGYISHVVQYVNGLETNRLATYPHDELLEGTFLVSRCSLPGQYVLRGSANRTCSERSWTGEEPRCGKKTYIPTLWRSCRPYVFKLGNSMHSKNTLYVSPIIYVTFTAMPTQ